MSINQRTVQDTSLTRGKLKEGDLTPSSTSWRSRIQIKKKIGSGFNLILTFSTIFIDTIEIFLMIFFEGDLIIDILS